MSKNIKIQPVLQSRLSTVDFNNLPFGRVFSDHYFSADFVNGTWKNLKIQPYGPIEITPANMALHYGQSIFEGMKVFKDRDGNPVIFRGDKHIDRINFSARRMAMAELPDDIFMEGLEELIKLDAEWIPDGEESALYVRPLMFATDEFIGVQASQTYKFLIFTCPVGAYYSKPVKLITLKDFIRAAPGGVGAAKTAGNYAASLYPAKLAKAQGYDQVMWLDGVHHKYVQEAGTMNLFFVIDGVVITPSLEENTILHGITRDSLIQIVKSHGWKVEERAISVEEIIAASKAGTLEEAFGAGTAAVTIPVAEIKHGDEIVKLPAIGANTLSVQLKKELTAIRKGVIEDRFGWVKKVEMPKLALV